MLVDYPVLHAAVDDAIGDHPYGEVAQRGNHTLPPSREIRVAGFQLQPAQGEIHVRVAVLGEFHGGERRGQPGLSGFVVLEPFLCLVLVRLPSDKDRRRYVAGSDQRTRAR
ncbi:hypothetical protein ACIQ6V_30420 [Streptomyces sp. NPDC096198]|uniref:hypothetical protein n=1 Tax=Streptomyces sp. NPDC096198 TaxID=3366080 RepID=UPI0038293EAA